jgi:hypothetical protein
MLYLLPFPLVSQYRLNLCAHGTVIPGIRFLAATILFSRDIWNVEEGNDPPWRYGYYWVKRRGVLPSLRGVLAGLVV